MGKSNKSTTFHGKKAKKAREKDRTRQANRDAQANNNSTKQNAPAESSSGPKAVTCEDASSDSEDDMLAGGGGSSSQQAIPIPPIPNDDGEPGPSRAREQQRDVSKKFINQVSPLDKLIITTIEEMKQAPREQRAAAMTPPVTAHPPQGYVPDPKLEASIMAKIYKQMDRGMYPTGPLLEVFKKMGGVIPAGVSHVPQPQPAQSQGQNNSSQNPIDRPPTPFVGSGIGPGAAQRQHQHGNGNGNVYQGSASAADIPLDSMFAPVNGALQLPGDSSPFVGVKLDSNGQLDPAVAAQFSESTALAINEAIAAATASAATNTATGNSPPIGNTLHQQTRHNSQQQHPAHPSSSQTTSSTSRDTRGYERAIAAANEARLAHHNTFQPSVPHVPPKDKDTINRDFLAALASSQICAEAAEAAEAAANPYDPYVLTRPRTPPIPIVTGPAVGREPDTPPPPSEQNVLEAIMAKMKGKGKQTTAPASQDMASSQAESSRAAAERAPTTRRGAPQRRAAIRSQETTRKMATKSELRKLAQINAENAIAGSSKAGGSSKAENTSAGTDQTENNDAEHEHAGTVTADITSPGNATVGRATAAGKSKTANNKATDITAADKTPGNATAGPASAGPTQADKGKGKAIGTDTGNATANPAHVENVDTDVANTTDDNHIVEAGPSGSFTVRQVIDEATGRAYTEVDRGDGNVWRDIPHKDSFFPRPSKRQLKKAAAAAGEPHEPEFVERHTERYNGRVKMNTKQFPDSNVRGAVDDDGDKIKITKSEGKKKVPGKAKVGKDWDGLSDAFEDVTGEDKTYRSWRKIEEGLRKHQKEEVKQVLAKVVELDADTRKQKGKAVATSFDYDDDDATEVDSQLTEDDDNLTVADDTLTMADVRPKKHWDHCEGHGNNKPQYDPVAIWKKNEWLVKIRNNVTPDRKQAQLDLDAFDKEFYNRLYVARAMGMRTENGLFSNSVGGGNFPQVVEPDDPDMPWYWSFPVQGVSMEQTAAAIFTHIMVMCGFKMNQPQAKPTAAAGTSFTGGGAAGSSQSFNFRVPHKYPDLGQSSRNAMPLGLDGACDFDSPMFTQPVKTKDWFSQGSSQKTDSKIDNHVSKVSRNATDPDVKGKGVFRGESGNTTSKIGDDSMSNNTRSGPTKVSAGNSKDTDFTPRLRPRMVPGSEAALRQAAEMQERKDKFQNQPMLALLRSHMDSTWELASGLPEFARGTDLEVVYNMWYGDKPRPEEEEDDDAGPSGTAGDDSSDDA